MNEEEINTVDLNQITDSNEVLGRAKEAELMVLLRRSPEIAEWLLDMTSIKAKKLYVKAKHKHAVAQINSNNKKLDGYWSTHIYVNGKRKAVLKATEDKLYEFLFEFYQEQDDKKKTFDEAFDRFIESKRDRGRSELTLKEYRRYHNLIPQSINKKDIALITEDELRKWFVNDFLARKPKKEAMKKMLQQLKAVFTFGIRNGYCFTNPAINILAEDYYKFCDLTTRSNEQRSFSDEEIEKLRTYCYNDRKNPHAAMMLVAMETGMRLGELAALKKTDVDSDYIWVHRQQVVVFDDERYRNRRIIDLEYTKNEKANPKGGRLIPITDNCRTALKIADEIPGESEYVFHHPNGKPIVKDSYDYYLRRRCKSLGIPISHNHAFRVAFNARLIEAGVDCNERCLVLGHSMQTNERHYSFSDKRKVDDVKNKLNKLKHKGFQRV